MANKNDKTKETTDASELQETSTPEEEEILESAEETSKEEEDSKEDETSPEEEGSDEAEDAKEDETSDDDQPDEEKDEDKEELATDSGGDDKIPSIIEDDEDPGPGEVLGVAAFFDLPNDLLLATAHTRDKGFKRFDAFSPFSIAGMNDALGVGRSWLPWVTFGAGTAGLLTANALEFGTMTFDWPMIIGGKPYAPWPSFVPVMFEMTVLFAGITTAITMFVASGCFRKPLIIDPEITKDRFALWISADDERFDIKKVREFMRTLDPVEIRTITKGA